MFLQVRWPNQQCQSTEGGWLVIQIALNLTRLISPCYNNTTCMHIQDHWPSGGTLVTGDAVATTAHLLLLLYAYWHKLHLLRLAVDSLGGRGQRAIEQAIPSQQPKTSWHTTQHSTKFKVKNASGTAVTLQSAVGGKEAENRWVSAFTASAEVFWIWERETSEVGMKEWWGWWMTKSGDDDTGEVRWSWWRDEIKRCK